MTRVTIAITPALRMTRKVRKAFTNRRWGKKMAKAISGASGLQVVGLPRFRIERTEPQ